MINIIVYVIVLVGVFTEALPKDLVDQYEERPEVPSNLFEGDIKLTMEQRAILDRDTLDESMGLGDNLMKRAVVTSDLTKRWPNATVPYVITSVPEIADIEAGIAYWNMISCVKFIPRTNEVDYLDFKNTGGCYSWLGRIGGKQQVAIGGGCSLSTVIHEMGHAIGFWHEMSRPDRDDFITVHWENLTEEGKHNYAIHSATVTHGVPYDFGSFMHYHRYGYSKNKQPTISAKNPADNDKIGKNIGYDGRPTAGDIQLANTIYECPTDFLCPEGWVYNGRSCYKVLANSDLTYPEAQTACQLEDSSSYVAVVNDAEENAFIDGLATPSKFWLGCNAMGGNYLWTCPDGSGKTFDGSTKTASPVDSYWNWDGNQPEVNTNQCQVQYQGDDNSWQSLPCTSRFPAICELKLCPEGWLSFRRSCYKVLPDKYPFSGAQSACQQQDASSYMAVVNDAKENAFIFAIVPTYYSWLGCTATGGNNLWTCPDGSGKMYDASTKTASPADSYWNWAEKQGYKNGQCLGMQFDTRGKFHSYPCYWGQTVTCELRACPGGWISNGRSCYKVLPDLYTFTDAQIECQQQEEGASYVTVVNDAEENAFIDDIAPGRVWLGCNAIDNANNMWTCPDGSGNPFSSPADSYWNWDGYPPEVNNEQCQVQYQGDDISWHSSPCTSTFRAICELPA